MASVVDSIRAVNSDNYALLKLGVFAYIFFILFEITTPPSTGKVGTSMFQNITYTQIAVLSFFYAGFSSIIMHNRITQSMATLPTFDPLKILGICGKCAVVMIPYLIVGIPVMNYAFSLFHFDGIPQLIALSIIELILVAIIVTALICFSRDYDIKETYNFKRLISGFPDVLVYTLVAIIMLGLVNVFVGLPILWFSYSFFDVGPVFRYVCFYIITMNMSYLADYSGPLSFDIEDREEL